jgi:hypothetical protein
VKSIRQVRKSVVKIQVLKFFHGINI